VFNFTDTSGAPQVRPYLYIRPCLSGHKES
jgi:hypothetical protein